MLTELVLHHAPTNNKHAWITLSATGVTATAFSRVVIVCMTSSVASEDVVSGLRLVVGQGEVSRACQIGSMLVYTAVYRRGISL
jgi:hypothetical protein